MKCRRILAALLAIAFALPFGAAHAGETYAKVRCAGAERQMSMRISPDGQSAVMARYYDGVRVTVLCDYGEWLLVSPGETDIGAPGYMNRGSLVFEGEKEYDAITEAAPWVMSAEPVWALYEDPDEEAEYALYGRGEAMLLLGETTSGWGRVRLLFLFFFPLFFFLSLYTLSVIFVYPSASSLSGILSPICLPSPFSTIISPSIGMERSL